MNKAMTARIQKMAAKGMTAAEIKAELSKPKKPRKCRATVNNKRVKVDKHGNIMWDGTASGYHVERTKGGWRVMSPDGDDTGMVRKSRIEAVNHSPVACFWDEDD